MAVADPERAAVIAALAGMEQRKPPSTYKPTLELRHGALSGTIDCIAKAIEGAASYLWQYSFDGMTWIDAPTTTRSYTTLTNLRPKAEVYVRFRALLRHSIFTEWSDPVSLIVI